MGVVDNLLAPELFSDGAFTFAIGNGVVRIVLTSIRYPQGAGTDPTHVVCGRLAMSVPAAQEFAIGLLDYLKKQGLDPTEAMKGGETPN